MALDERIPDIELFLRMTPADLAPVVLSVARTQLQNGHFHPSFILTKGIHAANPSSPLFRGERGSEVERAVYEALQWLETQLLIMPLPAANQASGYRRFTRLGEQLVDQQDFEAFRQAAAFPRSLLHLAIADRVWLHLARGDLSDAVFVAFRTVEEAVREKSGLGSASYGVQMMRTAFRPGDGPLSDSTQPESEQEALMHLFAGAIGSYKNPHSHRTVVINDASEAREMVLIASHLLRIVDSRERRAPAR